MTDNKNINQNSGMFGVALLPPVGLMACVIAGAILNLPPAQVRNYAKEIDCVVYHVSRDTNITEITWITNLDKTHKEKHRLIDYHSDGTIERHDLEKLTFTNPAIYRSVGWQALPVTEQDQSLLLKLMEGK